MKLFIALLLATTCYAENMTTTDPGNCGHDFDCSNLMDGWYPDVHNCRKYWSCSNHKAELHVCAENYLYDVEHNWCDFPDRVECGVRPICDNCDENCSDQPTVVSTTPAASTSPDPDHCTPYCKADHGDFAMGCCSNLFCKCEGGIGYVYPCPGGLVFVESIDQCDFISNVACCHG